MYRRLWFAAMSLVIFAALGGPRTATAETIEWCLVAGSVCTNGQQCCSEACWRYEDGKQLCLENHPE